MQLVIDIDPSWAASGPALAEILSRVRQLERPAPASSPALPARPREPGDADDLAELLEGIDGPEPAPAPPAAHAAPARPPVVAARPAAPSFDGTPRTGKGLYRWACDRKALPKVNAIGKAHGYPKLVSDWEPGQVAAAYSILSSEPAPNGRPH